MNKLYAKPVNRVSSDVNVGESKISKFVIFFVRLLKTAYLFSLFGFSKYILRGEDYFLDSFKNALSKKKRCIIAFRHPDGREPQLLLSFIIYNLKSIASKKKIKFERKPHAIFIYGYEVVRWGGKLARFIMPNLGAIPIHHTKLDSKGMEKINKAIADGHYPVALAPEGQVSYSTDTVPRLENGTIRLGMQAASLMESPVEILPVSVHFRYGAKGKKSMYKLLEKTERACGFLKNQTKEKTLHDRLKQCRDYILKLNEERYNIKSGENDIFEQRLDAVVNAALETAERALGIKPEGDFFPRLYKVRHHCWDKIFLPGVQNINKLTEIEREIKNLTAAESWYIARHQELADFGWYFKHKVPQDTTPLHLTVEYVQNLWDFANRTMGGAISNRINIPSSKVIIQTGAPINLSEYSDEYKKERKSTINKITLELEKAFVNCIEIVNKDFPD